MYHLNRAGSHIFGDFVQTSGVGAKAGDKLRDDAAKSVTWTEVSLTSLAALLTVMGYSVNETVISFDRIRENEHKLKDKTIERIIDISINERLTRTVMTAATVFAATLIMNIFGTGLVKNFAFAMNVGVIVATYSSIFLAAPIFLWISKKWYSDPPKRRRIPPVVESEATPAVP